MNIYTLSSGLYNTLPEGYGTTVTSVTCPDDTIRVTRDGSPYAMYISPDEDDSVISAELYDDSDQADHELVEPSIYWDIADGATIDTIAGDIVKYL